MMTASRHGTSADSMTQLKAVPTVTFRIVIQETGRALLQGFDQELQFTDAPDRHSRVAEFASRELAMLVLARLDCRAAMSVIGREWPPYTDKGWLKCLKRAVGDTGACASLFLWNPQLHREIPIGESWRPA